MLNCQKCGFSNELGRIFCHSCGTKLDLSQIKAPSQGGAKIKSKKKSAGRKNLRMFIELFVLLGLMALIFLMVQVPERPTEKPNGAAVSAAENKRFDLERLVSRAKPGKITLTENELNAYLGNLAVEKAPAGWVVFTPSLVQVDFLTDQVEVKLWGELALFTELKKDIFFSYTCTPAVEDGVFSLHPVAGKIGSVPLATAPLDLTTIVQRFIGAYFRKLNKERATLGKLSAITIADEKAVLEYQPATDAGK
jgi:hypothetical protein